MTLRFDDPAWLWLLLLGVPALVISLRWLGTMSPIRRLSVALTRILLILLLVAMLAGASTVRTTDRVAVIAVLDVSGSVARFAAPLADPQGVGVSAPDAARRFVTVATGGRGPDDLVGAVAFASGPLAVLAPARAAPLPDDLPTTSPEGTDISAALRLARAMIPPDAAGRIVLVSDGNQTGGDALAVARELAAAQPPVRVDVVPIRYEVRAEVVLESLQAPAQAPQGSTITLRAVLASTASSTGTLRLLEEGQPVDISPGQPGDGRRISLAPGRHVEVITLPLGPRRVHRFEAIYEPDPLAPADGAGAPPAFAGDTVLANNRGQAFTLTPGTGAVLVADGVSGAAPGPGALLPRTLQDEGLEVQVVAPEGIPGDLLALEAFDLVILQNVPAESVPPEVRRLLALYVTELGGGLVMVGGHDSFGAGGWIGSELEPILPVHLDLPDTLVVPPAAIMLVLDNSGSMNRRLMGSARTQQEIANEGAALAVASMDRSDLVGVIAFNSVHSTLVPLGPNADPERTSRVIRSIGSGGGTEIRGALEEAHRQLRQAKAQIKHIVLLTDGIAPDAEQLPALAERLAADGIAVSAIAVGDAADTVNLPMMARRSGGTYYRVNDPNVLPRIFLKAVRVVRTPMVREGRFEPAVRPGSPLVEGLEDPPPLTGFVLTRHRDDPTAVSAMITATGEPLLAHWNAGLGRVAAWTSDAHHWAEAWVGWPGYRRLWVQITRLIARSDAARGAELAAEFVNGRLHVRLDMSGHSGEPLDLLAVPARVFAPTGRTVQTRLAQTAPGTYEGSIPAPESGVYTIMLTPRHGERRLMPVLGGAARQSGVEYQRLRSDLALLEDLARTTGGEVYDLAAGLSQTGAPDLFARRAARPGEARAPLWRLLLPWTLAVMLLDVATRRIAWDRFVSRQFGADRRRAVADALRDRGLQAAGTLERLRAGGRSDAGTGPTGTALTPDDARRVALEASRRRRERAIAPRPAATQGPGPQGPERPASPPSDAGAALRAAKHRARQRMEGEPGT